MIRASAVTVDIGRTRLLHGVDLAVGKGEWVCVLGPNGAGKSTLMRAIAGLVPHGGDVVLDGDDVGSLGTRQRSLRLALVPQQPVVPPGITIDDYLLLGRTPHIPTFGTERPGDLSAVDDVAHRLDLEPFRRRRLDSLSGGERQRVILGRALVQSTPVLLLDEPTTALDIGHQQEVLDLIDELRHERGLTVLSTVHDLTVAGQYADRLVLLAGGRVVAEGGPRDVLREDLLRAHFGAEVQVVHGPSGTSVIPVRARRPRPYGEMHDRAHGTPHRSAPPAEHPDRVDRLGEPARGMGVGA